jgi:2-keto-4-pentenoate hydratase/2-oxohepta-3-ene-1,7-dioic acid hydratase in catechol pathway
MPGEGVIRLLSYVYRGESGFGFVKDGGVVALRERTGLPDLKSALSSELEQFASEKPDFGLDEIEFRPVIPNPDKILCVGINYVDHQKETGREKPERPVIFTRFANTQVGHGEPMIRPGASEQLDFEGELAVVIGRRGRHIPQAEALSFVAGYACYNDGSVRDWQRHTSQFTPGKNFVGTGAFGPWLVTGSEAAGILDAAIATRLNGQEVQRARTSELVFGIPELIEYVSTFTELAPGDVISTGTPGGVGAARKPPLWMKPGDVVEVEIERIGVLRNPIRAE